MKKFIAKNKGIIYGGFLSASFAISIFSIVIAMLNTFIG